MTPSTFPVRKAAVLGAGVMGAQIAAHFANAGIPSLLFDLTAKEGDPAGPLFLIQDGRVRSWHAEGGRPARIMNLGAGEYFGEVSAVRGTPRAATVEATTRVRLLTLGGESIARLSASPRSSYPTSTRRRVWRAVGISRDCSRDCR